MPKIKAKIKKSKLIVKVRLLRNEHVNERELEYLNMKCFRGLLKPVHVKKLGFDGIEYSGVVGISLAERLQRPITRYEFFLILEELIVIIRKLRMNALSIAGIVWDFRYVYINEMTNELGMIYLPLEQKLKENNLVDFIEHLALSAKPSEDTQRNFAVDFINFFNNMDMFEIDRIEEYIERTEWNVIGTVKKRFGNGQSGFITDKPKDYYAHYAHEERMDTVFDDESTGLLMEDGEETTLLTDDEETTLLQEEARIRYPHLMRLSNQEVININKPVFRIGKEVATADYPVANNRAVSRKHADIVTRGNMYFVIDLNSKNRTFINNQPISAQQETEIHDGDRLKLANEEFDFYI